MYNQFFTIKPRISEKRRKQSCTSNNINIYHVLGRDHVTFLLERKRTKRIFLCMYVRTYTHIHTKNFHFLRFRSRKKITWLLSWICKNRREDEKWSLFLSVQWIYWRGAVGIGVERKIEILWGSRFMQMYVLLTKKLYIKWLLLYNNLLIDIR